MVKTSEFSEGQDEEEDDSRTGESDPVFKIASMIYQRIIFMHPMVHKLEANNGNGTMKPLNISKSSICSINRNPADFNMPEVGNGYMIRSEDLKFGKQIPFSRRHGLVKMDQHNWQRNMKALYQKGNVHHIEFDEGKLFQEKAREVDEESNEMILRTRNVETQGEIVLNLHGIFFQEKTSEVDKESNEMILRTRYVEIQGETVLDYCMDIVFQEKALEADKELSEMTLKTRAVAELARKPKLMKKAQEEVRRCIGNKGKISERDIDELQYLKMIIKETRLHPPAPMIVPGEIMSHFKIQGYDIDHKTLVFVNGWAIA
ncbi:unnamed protein product [Prunus brigantina]